MPSADTKQLLLQVDASVALAQRKLGELARSVDRDTTSMDRALGRVDAATERLGGALGSLRNVAAALGVTLGAAGAVSAVRGFLGYADAAKTLEAQLRLATASSGSFSQAQEDVRRISSETRSSLEATASLYATFQRNARELGITQEQAARATEAVSLAFQISGASAAEAEGGLRQFLQGLQSGTLRGEELNSVLEQAPRLARLLADALGVPIGQLRELAEQGRITGEVIIAALIGALPQLRSEFRELPVTFDQAMQQISNAATTAFGAFDRGGSFSQSLAGFAIDGAHSFASISRDAENAGARIRAVFDGLGNLFDPIVADADGAFGYIASLFESLSTDMRAGSRALDDILYNWPNFGILPTAMMRRGLMERHPGFRDSAAAAEAAEENSLRARTQNAGLLGAFRDQRNFYRDRAAPPRPPRPSGGGGARGGGGRGRSARRATALGSPGYEFDPSYSAAQLRAYDASQLPLWLREMEERDLRPNLDFLRVTTEEMVAELDRLEASLPDVGQMIDAAERERLLVFAREFNEDLASGLAEAIVYGKSLGDVLINSIQRATAALLESAILDLLSGAFGGKGGAGGFIGAIGSAIGSLFGGGRAAGGPVSPGKAYVVGERRPELFVPRVPGVIVPHVGGGGNGTVDVRVHLDGKMLRAEIVSTSHGVAAQVVGEAAPIIAVKGAGMAIKELTRVRLP